VLYYLGEIVDSFHWEMLRWSFCYGVHDVQRLFFMGPVLYVDPTPPSNAARHGNHRRHGSLLFFIGSLAYLISPPGVFYVRDRE
jgi:hypothetical protein